MIMKSSSTIELIIRGLASLKEETPFVEFKVNNADPDAAGERISALSNMALLCNRPYAYLVWGVDDKTHVFVGTELSFQTWKKGKEDILAYWKNLLLPSLEIQPYELQIDGSHILALEIPAASHFATIFKKQAYCRIGSYTKNIKEYPALEKELWGKLSHTAPERRIVKSGLGPNELDSVLDFHSYFTSLSLPEPSSLNEKIARFVREGFLVADDEGNYSATALGALLFGRDLSSFDGLMGKEIRILRYVGNDRLQTKGKVSFSKGYAISFEEAYSTILSSIQEGDIFVNGIRQDRYSLPPIALREALGNILIHQELLGRGGPLVEIFSSRVELSNPGSLGVPVDRLIDASPNPENELLASFLRRINIGDTAGSGFDKIVGSLEKEHLPPVRVEENPSGVRVVLSFTKPFDDYMNEEKLRATYDHVVLRYLSGTPATNGSLRERFGLPETAKFKISRLLSLTSEKGMIRKGEGSDKKETYYLPYWA